MKNSPNSYTCGEKRMLVFINDINMPSADKYGTQPPLELIRFKI